MKVLSFGAGVNSSAILILHKKDMVKFDAVVFADTHAEHPETYRFIESVVKPFCEDNELPFDTVSFGDLFKDYWQKQIIPYRRFRSCTDKYKIRPIRKFVNKTYGKNTVYILGIDYGERHRTRKYCGSDYEYPLIDLKIDREGCKQIIRDFGWKVPIKSGCYFCPFTRKKGWTKLLENHRDLFLKAEKFEQNSGKYPKYGLTSKPLQRIREAIENQQGLCNWLEVEGDPCVFCHG